MIHHKINHIVKLYTVYNAFNECIYLWAQEIYQDRKKFSEQVFKVASSDLVNMGIGVVSYTLKDVHDDQVLYIRLGSFSSDTNDKIQMIKAPYWTLVTGAAGICSVTVNPHLFFIRKDFSLGWFPL